MRKALRLFCFLSTLCFSHFSLAQNCEGILAKSTTLNGALHLVSQPQTMIIRGNYIYNLELEHDSKGLALKLYSKRGVQLNQGDELIFIDDKNIRKSFQFAGIINNIKEGNTPIHSNWISLTESDLQWLAKQKITVIFIKNNAANEMRKYPVTESRQREFRQLAYCFLSFLNKEEPQKTVEKEQPTSTDSLESKNVEALKKELAQLKLKLRDEIAQEYEKAERVKKQLREEIRQARIKANEQKKAMAEDVKSAREASIAIIEKERSAALKEIDSIRSHSQQEIQIIWGNLQSNKLKATEELEKARLASANEIVKYRNRAQKEQEAILAELENIRIKEAERIATTKLKADKEIQTVRTEVQAFLKTIKEQSFIENELQSNRVTAYREEAEEQLKFLEEEVAEKVALLKEQSIIAQQKLEIEFVQAQQKLANEQVLAKEKASQELVEIREKVAKEKLKAAEEVNKERQKVAELIATLQLELAHQKDSLLKLQLLAEQAYQKRMMETKDSILQHFTQYKNRLDTSSWELTTASININQNQPNDSVDYISPNELAEAYRQQVDSLLASMDEQLQLRKDSIKEVVIVAQKEAAKKIYKAQNQALEEIELMESQIVASIAYFKQELELKKKEYALEEEKARLESSKNVLVAEQEAFKRIDSLEQLILDRKQEVTLQIGQLNSQQEEEVLEIKQNAATSIYNARQKAKEQIRVVKRETAIELKNILKEKDQLQSLVNQLELKLEDLQKKVKATEAELKELKTGSEGSN